MSTDMIMESADLEARTPEKLSYEDHYKSVAANYNKFYTFTAQAKVDFIKSVLPLSQEDQVVDIGGGTGMISLMLKEQLGLSKPVVCVDPSKEMLDVAHSHGAITIHSTAETFLETEPAYPLNKVLMVSCVHHFKNREAAFVNLAKHMPDGGMCLIMQGSCMDYPVFKACKKLFSQVHIVWSEMVQMLESNGFECKEVSSVLPVQCEKELWVDSIRNRAISILQTFSDSQLEEGIREMEEELRDQGTLFFTKTFDGILVTKK